MVAKEDAWFARTAGHDKVQCTASDTLGGGGCCLAFLFGGLGLQLALGFGYGGQRPRLRHCLVFHHCLVFASRLSQEGRGGKVIVCVVVG